MARPDSEGRDITDLKRAARVAEERYRLLSERAGDGIWLADQDGHFIDVNPAAIRMLGYAREEHLASSVGDIVRPQDIARLRGLMFQLAEGHQVTDVLTVRAR